MWESQERGCPWVKVLCIGRAIRQPAAGGVSPSALRSIYPAHHCVSQSFPVISLFPWPLSDRAPLFSSLTVLREPHIPHIHSVEASSSKHVDANPPAKKLSELLLAQMQREATPIRCCKLSAEGKRGREKSREGIRFVLQNQPFQPRRQPTRPFTSWPLARCVSPDRPLPERARELEWS